MWTPKEGIQILKKINLEFFFSKSENKAKIGETFEFFLSGGNLKLIDNLYNYRGTSFSFKNLFNVNIMLEKTNKNSINYLKKIPENKENEKNDRQEGLSNDKKYKANHKYKIINKDENNKINDLDEYTKQKRKLLHQDSFRKYTFPKNTIYCQIIDYENNQIVPEQQAL